MVQAEESKIYDSLIIGGGPAGITAAIYAARYNLKVAIITEIFGGEIGNATKIENYPGFVSITGADLVKKLEEHVTAAAAEIILANVKEIKKIDNDFEVIADKTYRAKTIILAQGLERRKLPAKGAKEFEGKGVAYCATCDGPLFKGKNVIVVGGGNAGVIAAIYLAGIAKKLYLVEAMDKLLADPVSIEKLKKKSNVEIILSETVEEVRGEATVNTAILKNKGEIKVDGIFVEIGSIPNARLPKELGIEVDEKGFIKVEPDQATNIEGIFAAGDSTTASNYFRQSLTAMAEGAIAAAAVQKYLTKKS